MNAVQKAKKKLEVELNYGGIFVGNSHTTKHISMAYEQGDLPDEIGQMRRIANAFNNLANTLESTEGDE